MLFSFYQLIFSTMDIRKNIAQELHKPARRNFLTRNVELKGINDLYQADLVEMIPYAKFNKGYRYILTMINCFSKFAFAVPLKTKTSVEVVKALAPILKRNKMRHLQTDQGKEWFNFAVQNLLRSHNINHYNTFSQKKASIVERYNRTLKSLMWRKMTEIGSYTWINMLPQLINLYNNTPHSTIGMRPVDVTFSNENLILNKLKNRMLKNRGIKHSKYKIGDRVRISKFKKVFTKGYLPNWTNEIFTIHEIKPTVPKTYILKDYRGNVLMGGFYAEEISKTKYGNVYLIEKILRRRGDKLFVRWLGFDKSHDSWVDKANVI